jgi:hypothetical protein
MKGCVCTVHELAVLSDVTTRVLVVVVEPDEKRDGLTLAYCVRCVA